MLSRYIIPGEEIHCREAEERAAKNAQMISAKELPREIKAGQARPNITKGQLSPTDDSIDWLERLYALLDLREHIAAAV
jgi:hypothetical protein